MSSLRKYGGATTLFVLAGLLISIFAFAGVSTRVRSTVKQSQPDSIIDSAPTANRSVVNSRMAPETYSLLSFSSDQSQQLKRCFRLPSDKSLPRRLQISDALHLLHISRCIETDVNASRLEDSLIAALTQSQAGKQFFGESPMVRTRLGVRYAVRIGDPGGFAENHKDYVLARFAQLGLPLSFPIELHGESLTIRDVLAESMATFYLKQQDLEWSTQSFALYLPPETSFQDRFQHRITFDDIANELLDRDPSDCSCGGLHRLYTLRLLEWINNGKAILSRTTAERIRREVGNAILSVLDRQRPDGSWDYVELNAAWSGSKAKKSFVNPAQSQLLITGHLCELLLFIRDDDVAPNIRRQALQRGGEWLKQNLLKASPNAVWLGLCPYSHAMFACTHLSGKGGFQEQ